VTCRAVLAARAAERGDLGTESSHAAA
jgi:hypothetical protein